MLKCAVGVGPGSVNGKTIKLWGKVIISSTPRFVELTRGKPMGCSQWTDHGLVRSGLRLLLNNGLSLSPFRTRLNLTETHRFGQSFWAKSVTFFSINVYDLAFK